MLILSFYKLNSMKRMSPTDVAKTLLLCENRSLTCCEAKVLESLLVTFLLLTMWFNFNIPFEVGLKQANGRKEKYKKEMIMTQIIE